MLKFIYFTNLPLIIKIKGLRILDLKALGIVIITNYI